MVQHVQNLVSAMNSVSFVHLIQERKRRYQLLLYFPDINALVGNSLPINIPQVVVKWLTYCLVLHIVALALAAISAFFGLLAHVREMSMSCFSTCVSGFAASVALLAFIFDLAFFFVAKSRINSVKGGSASIGTGIWLTLAAWLCLFFAGCFFGIGRTCLRRRSRDSKGRGLPSTEAGYPDQMRLEAVKAEADRKARQRQGETGLPTLPETEPLTKGDDGEIYIEEGPNVVAYRRADSQSPPRAGGPGAGVGAGTASYARQGAQLPGRQQSPYAGGYAQAIPGTRAVDDYYNNTRPQANSSYPPQQPQPRRQASQLTQSSGYTGSPYSDPAPPPMPTVAANLGALGAATQYGGGQYGHNQYATAATSAQDHEHARGATCEYTNA